MNFKIASFKMKFKIGIGEELKSSIEHLLSRNKMEAFLIVYGRTWLD